MSGPGSVSPDPLPPAHDKQSETTIMEFSEEVQTNRDDPAASDDITFSPHTASLVSRNAGREPKIDHSSTSARPLSANVPFKRPDSSGEDTLPGFKFSAAPKIKLDLNGNRKASTSAAHHQSARAGSPPFPGPNLETQVSQVQPITRRSLNEQIQTADSYSKIPNVEADSKSSSISSSQKHNKGESHPENARTTESCVAQGRRHYALSLKVPTPARGQRLSLEALEATSIDTKPAAEKISDQDHGVVSSEVVDDNKSDTMLEKHEIDDHIEPGSSSKQDSDCDSEDVMEISRNVGDSDEVSESTTSEAQSRGPGSSHDETVSNDDLKNCAGSTSDHSVGRSRSPDVVQLVPDKSAIHRQASNPPRSCRQGSTDTLHGVSSQLQPARVEKQQSQQSPATPRRSPLPQRRIGGVTRPAGMPIAGTFDIMNMLHAKLRQEKQQASLALEETRKKADSRIHELEGNCASTQSRLESLEKENLRLLAKAQQDRKLVETLRARATQMENFINGFAMDFNRLRQDVAKAESKCIQLVEDRDRQALAKERLSEHFDHNLKRAQGLQVQAQDLINTLQVRLDAVTKEKEILECGLNEKAGMLVEQRDLCCKLQSHLDEIRSVPTRLKEGAISEQSAVVEKLEEVRALVEKMNSNDETRTMLSECAVYLKAEHSTEDASREALENVQGALMHVSTSLCTKIEQLATSAGNAENAESAFQAKLINELTAMKIDLDHSSSLQAENASLREAKAEFDQRLASSNSTLATLKEEVASVRATEASLKDRVRELKTAAAANERSTNQRNDIAHQLSLAKNRNEGLEAELERTRAEIKDTSKRLVASSALESDLRKQVGDLQTRSKTAQDTLANLQSEQTSRLEKSAQAWQAERRTLNQEAEVLRAKQKAEYENQLLQAENREIRLESRLKESMTKNSTFETQLQSLDEKIHAKDDLIKEAKSAAQADILEKEEQLQELLNREASLAQHSESLKQQLESVAVECQSKEKNINAIMAEKTSAENDLKTLQLSLQSMRNDLEASQASNQKLEDDLLVATREIESMRTAAATSGTSQTDPSSEMMLDTQQWSESQFDIQFPPAQNPSNLAHDRISEAIQPSKDVSFHRPRKIANRWASSVATTEQDLMNIQPSSFYPEIPSRGGDRSEMQSDKDDDSNKENDIGSFERPNTDRESFLGRGFPLPEIVDDLSDPQHSEANVLAPRSANRSSSVLSEASPSTPDEMRDSNQKANAARNSRSPHAMHQEQPSIRGENGSFRVDERSFTTTTPPKPSARPNTGSKMSKSKLAPFFSRRDLENNASGPPNYGGLRSSIVNPTAPQPGSFKDNGKQQQSPSVEKSGLHGIDSGTLGLREQNSTRQHLTAYHRSSRRPSAGNFEDGQQLERPLACDPNPFDKEDPPLLSGYNKSGPTQEDSRAVLKRAATPDFKNPHAYSSKKQKTIEGTGTTKSKANQDFDYGSILSAEDAVAPFDMTTNSQTQGQATYIRRSDSQTSQPNVPVNHSEARRARANLRKTDLNAKSQAGPSMKIKGFEGQSQALQTKKSIASKPPRKPLKAKKANSRTKAQTGKTSPVATQSNLRSSSRVAQVISGRATRGRKTDYESVFNENINRPQR
ncbi:MAG: hypothetical protein M1820_007988 [Bogoriella megaspora]|nr:MAG: hypothetical protein M1820_007988 [Bogoriella megaspora]